MKLNTLIMEGMSKMMLNCDESTHLVSKSQHTKLSFKERMHLKFHLFTCRLCQQYNKQINNITNFIKKLSSNGQSKPETITLSTEKKNKMKEVLSNQIE